MAWIIGIIAAATARVAVTTYTNGQANDIRSGTCIIVEVRDVNFFTEDLGAKAEFKILIQLTYWIITDVNTYLLVHL